jgi:hypothetical protein
MLDPFVNVQEPNKRKRKLSDRRKTLQQWLLEYEDYENFSVYEPRKTRRTKSAAQEYDDRDYRPQKRGIRRQSAREPKWMVDK